MVAPAAALIGGATPFGWATLGAGLLGGMAGGATPAGPSSADALFGSSFMSNDSSGWMLNFGDGATSALDNGQRGAPNQTPVNSYAPGGQSNPVNAPGNTAAAVAGTLGNLPWIYIIGGAVLVALIWKKA